MQIQNRDAGYDTLKGVGILVIVLGHNPYLKVAFPAIADLFYAFNVHLFFILSILLSSREFSLKLVAVRVVRYGVPFVLFLSLGWGVLQIIDGRRDSFQQEVLKLLSGLFWGTSYYTKESGGFFLFWFLPTLFTLSLFHSLALKYAVLKKLFLLLSFVFVGCVGFIPDEILRHGFCGVFPALWVYGPACLVVSILRSNYMQNIVVLSSMLGFSVLGIVFIFLGIIQTGELHSFYRHSIDNPLNYLFIVGLPISITPLLFPLCAYFDSNRFFVWAGLNSLVIYLFHQFVFRALDMIVGRFWHGSSTLKDHDVSELYVRGGILFVLTLGGCYLVVLFLDRFEVLKSFLFPRHLESWPPSLIAKRLVRNR